MRLILNPMYPDDEYHQPAASKPAPQITFSVSGVPATPIAPAMKVSIQPFDNFRETLDRAGGTKLELALLNLFSISLDATDRTSKTTIESPVCFLHQLRNPETYFKAVCKDSAACEWMEEQALSPRTSVYLVCGFKTLTDAKVGQKTMEAIDVDPSATVPVVLPPGIGNVSASVHYKDESSEDLRYTARGERVYVVQCRKICFSWFSTKGRIAYLWKENRNCWKSYIGGGRVEDTGE
ncbi:MAG: hypothetical protein ACREHG_00585, partial [Candidatus Saccharimonadales bacterium]